ncbi:MAG: PIG-L family deacetylase [Vicinamibacterales bacterium]|nr:PIG-L family deacetylase [Vicinamibacterales bacterium]
MKLSVATAEIYVPDGTALDEALARTTHLAIGAHQDDLEIMAADGILQCYQRSDRWFTGVIVTDGAGSPRAGLYGAYTDEAMKKVRRVEQKKAAFLGDFAAAVLLDHPSGAIKDAGARGPIDDLVALLEATRPEVVYTHNLCDKHDTHIAVAWRVIAAIRRASPRARPARLLGCEVWRDLDWLADAEKVAFDLTLHQNLQMALVGVFDSQISGGKRYDLATWGRRKANATYAASHGTDEAEFVSYAMDLTPLVTDPSLDPVAYATAAVQRFQDDVAARMARFRPA